jgi:integrase
MAHTSLTEEVKIRISPGMLGDPSVNRLRRVIVETSKRIGRNLPFETVRSYAQRWLEIKKAECEPSTLGFYSATIDRFLTWLGPRAERMLGEVYAHDIRDFLNDRRLKVSARTANHELKSLKTFFRAARADILIGENPTEFLKPFKEPKTLPRRPFTADEIRAVLAVADPEWRSMVLCALYTGQRLADIATLTWQNFDLAANEFRIVTRKTGKTLIAPLPAPLREHLESLPKPANRREPLHARAFASVMEQQRAGALSREFGELLADAGLRAHKKHRKAANGRDGSHERHEVSFHTFRRTATTWLHEAGVPPAVVQALIGHDSIDEHQGYIGVGKAALVEAATKFPRLAEIPNHFEGGERHAPEVTRK